MTHSYNAVDYGSFTIQNNDIKLCYGVKYSYMVNGDLLLYMVKDCYTTTPLTIQKPHSIIYNDIVFMPITEKRYQDATGPYSKYYLACIREEKGITPDYIYVERKEGKPFVYFKVPHEIKITPDLHDKLRTDWEFALQFISELSKDKTHPLEHVKMIIDKFQRQIDEKQQQSTSQLGVMSIASGTSCISGNDNKDRQTTRQLEFKYRRQAKVRRSDVGQL